MLAIEGHAPLEQGGGGPKPPREVETQPMTDEILPLSEVAQPLKAVEAIASSMAQERELPRAEGATR